MPPTINKICIHGVLTQTSVVVSSESKTELKAPETELLYLNMIKLDIEMVKIMVKDFLLKHSQELSKKYPGKYIAVVDSKLVAIGNSNLEVFKKAKEVYPKKMVSISYIPRKDELVTLERV